MNNLQQFTNLPFLHHAYGIESAHSIAADIEMVIPRSEFSYVVHKHYDSLKIADARQIKSLQSEKTEKASLFILEFTLINREAQNTLLKVLEEPTANTYFILVFPNRKMLLPTLQSRLQFINYQSKVEKHTESVIDVADFVESTLQSRFDVIKKLTDKKSDTPLKKSDCMRFLNTLEEYLHEHKQLKNLHVVFKARQYLSANGASVKMILEMLAIEISYE